MRALATRRRVGGDGSRIRGRGALRPAEPRDGFTLIELMVALTILAFGLMAMMAMQIHALRGGGLGRHSTQAAQIAKDQMEFFQRLDFDDAQLDDTGGWVLAGNQVTNTVQGGSVFQEEETYTVDWRIVDDGANPELKHVDVRVTWRELNDQPQIAARRYAISSIRYED